MVALLETKVASVNTNRSFNLLSQSLPNHIIIPGTGQSGEMWICWDPLSISAEVVYDSNQHVTLSHSFTGTNVGQGLLSAHYCVSLPKLAPPLPTVGFSVVFSLIEI